MEEIKLLRTARELKIDEDFLNNSNVNAKIGASENRNKPDTIYIEFSFWIKNQSEITDNLYLRKKIKKDLKDIYVNYLSKVLKHNFYFPNYKENIFIINVPDNINYNDKKNFVSLELYLHTINNNSDKPYPLNKNSELHKETLKIAKLISESDVLNNKFEFEITKNK